MYILLKDHLNTFCNFAAIHWNLHKFVQGHEVEVQDRNGHAGPNMINRMDQASLIAIKPIPRDDLSNHHDLGAQTLETQACKGFHGHGSPYHMFTYRLF